MRFFPLVALVAISFSGLASAQDAPGDAAARFSESVDLMDAGRHREAVDLLRDLLADHPRASVAFNLALSRKEIGQLGRAFLLLEGLVAGEYGVLTDEQRVAVAASRAELELELATVVLQVSGVDAATVGFVDEDGDRVTVGGATPGSPVLLRVAPGDRVIWAEAGNDLREARARVARGGRLETAIVFEVATVETDPAPEVQPQETLPPDPEIDEEGGVSAWVWILGGLALVGGGVALAFALSSDSSEPAALGTLFTLGSP